MILGVTTSDLRHCGNMPYEREELNTSVTDRRSASRPGMSNLLI